MQNSILYTYDKERFIREGDFRWKLNALKTKKRFNTLRIITCVIIAVMGFSSAKNIYGLLLTFACICAGLVILSLYYTYAQKKSNEAYAGQVRELADDYEQKQMNVRYEFSNASVKYLDSERQMDFPWESFTAYTIRDSYLILSMKNGNTYLFEETTNGPEADNYKQIRALVQAKLPVK